MIGLWQLLVVYDGSILFLEVADMMVFCRSCLSGVFPIAFCDSMSHDGKSRSLCSTACSVG